jgi:hypothetical protein
MTRLRCKFLGDTNMSSFQQAYTELSKQWEKEVNVLLLQNHSTRQ